MIKHHSYLAFVFCFLLGWCNAQSGLVRINTASDSSVRMHSFSAPFPKKLDFWEPGAGTIITPEYIELTPAKQGSTGLLWNMKKAYMADWEASFEFKLAGRADVGGDGFAFWYTDKKGMVGPVFGTSDYWTGLGVFFDTYDNDQKDESPLITLCVNDGTYTYLSDSDGASHAAGKCSFKIRNTPEKIAARIRYSNSILSIEIALKRDVFGLPIFLSCSEVKNIHLSPEGFFGMSAHTGDLADSHHIYSMVVKDLTPMHKNLVEEKKRWDQEQETLHLQHNDLSDSAFKNVMLTQLRQTQEEVNMIEMSTLSDAQEINKGLEMIGLLEVLLNNVFSQFRTKMNVADDKRMDQELLNAGSTLQNDVQGDFEKVKALAYNLKSPIGSTASKFPSQVAQVQSLITNINRDLATFRKNMDTTKSQLDQLVQQIISQDEVIYSSQPNGGGGSGWLTYIVISIVTIPIGGALMHFCQPKKNKYKGWD